MKLDLFDAVRLRLVVEIKCDGEAIRVEPHEFRVVDGKTVLHAFDTAPDGGWREYSDWTDLRITSVHFEERANHPK